MSKILEKSKTEILTLPPNVNGPVSGVLEFCLEGFRWKGNKTFPSIEAKFQFWGQDHDTASASILYHANNITSNNRCLKYHIVTSPELFQSYLSNSKPIRVKLVSLKTGNLIGASVIRIPEVIAKLQQQEKVKETSSIFSPNGFILGSIITSFKLTGMKMVEQQMMVKSPEKPKPRIEVLKAPPAPQAPMLPQRTSTKEGPTPTFSDFLINNVPSISSITSSETDSKDISDKQKSRMMDYLMGKSIPPSMENEILKEICTLSPATSLLEVFKDLTIESPPISLKEKTPFVPQTKPQSKSSINFLNRIDSVRFAVHGFTATKAGIKQIIRKTQTGKVSEFNIAVECQICGGNQVLRTDETNTMYFISKGLNIDNLMDKIDINKQNYRGLKDPKKFFESGVFLTFILWIRDSKTKISHILGASRIPVGSLLEQKLMTGGKIAIKAIKSEIIVGILSFQVELASRTMTFGSEQQLNNDKKSSMNDNQGESSSRERPTNSIKSNSLNDSNKSASTKTSNNEKSNTDDLVFNSLMYFGGFKQSQGRQIQLQLSFFDLFSNDFVKINSIGSNFHNLRVLPIQITDEFLSKMKHNFILVEAYEHNSLVASIKLPLQQFFIAFRDNDIKNHLSKAKLPVISIDGWNNLLTTGELEVFGQLQVLLAVGTELQIETLKVTRGLGTTMNFEVPSSSSASVLNSNSSKTLKSSNAETQTTPRPSLGSDNGVGGGAGVSSLSNFIDSLAQKVTNGQSLPNKATLNGNNQHHQPQQLRNTGDLLDMLQKALQQKPTPQQMIPLKSVITPSDRQSHCFTHTQNQEKNNLGKTFKVLVEVEQAQKLPMVKLNKKQKQKFKAKGKTVNEVEPSAYVTFEAANGNPDDQVKSHEGMVFTTDVCEKTCDPVWNKRFEVTLPHDMFYNVEKNFVLKVWRKSPILEPSKLQPSPLQDAVIGFSAINIKELTCGSPSISNWFKIIDFNGRCNGQIKVNLTLQSSSSSSSSNAVIDTANSNKTAPTATSVHDEEDDHDDDDDDEFSSALSRALKRKFNELEGISQRLKTRLMDVTANDEDDVDDEFERDLNTVAVEDAITDTDDFAWLGNVAAAAESASTCSSVFQPNLFKSILDDVPSTSTSSTDRHINQLSKVFHRTSLSEDEEKRENSEETNEN